MTRHVFPTRASFAVLLAGLLNAVPPAAAQDQELEEVLVRATHSRLPEDLSSFAGSVTVLGFEDLDEQSLFNSDMAIILGRLVPGYGVGNAGSQSNFGQTMRGRSPAVFVDGVPATVTLRNGGRDVRVISPAALERVEIIRGSTAVYGLGGAGGIINYVTKELSEKEAGLAFRTDASVGGSLTNSTDSLTYMLTQNLSTRTDRFSLVLSGMYEVYNGLFDAEGDRIAPDPHQQGGIADSDSYNLFAKAGFDLTDNARVWASANVYESEQDTNYSRGVGNFGSVKTPAAPVAPAGENQFLENRVLTAGLQVAEVLNSSFSVLAFYSDYGARFSFAPYPDFPPSGGQSTVEAERVGGKLDFNTPLSLGWLNGNALWGVDYTEDTTAQPTLDGRYFVPQMDHTAWAPFLQLELHPRDWLTITGGVRHENAEVSVDTFTTIAFLDNPCCRGGNTVQGGTLDYSDTIFNVGGVISPFEQGFARGLSLFASWSQGFTINEFGRTLRNTTAPSIEFFSFDPQIVDSYELGVRFEYDNWKGSIAGFYNESDLGSTYNTVTGVLLRTPEEVRGVETTFEVKPTSNWLLGMTYSWADGEREASPGQWIPLDSTRINQPKFTAYADYELSESWSANFNLMHARAQKQFAGNPRAFGQADIAAFTLIDIAVSKHLPVGKLSVAVQNVLNTFYLEPYSFTSATNTAFAAGPGATARVTYTVNY